MTRASFSAIDAREAPAAAPRLPRVVLHPAERTRAGAPTVLTIGKFDGVHRGHQAVLARAREAATRHGASLTVMTFYPHPRDFLARAKAMPAPAAACGPRVANLRDTLAALGEAGVDCVVFQRFDAHFAALSAQRFIDEVLVARLGVCALFVGDDFRFGARRAGDIAMLAREGERHGFSVESLASVNDAGVDATRISSSAVRAALGAADLAGAARMLGRPYSMSGRLIPQSIPDSESATLWRFHGGASSPLPAGAYAIRLDGLGEGAVDARLYVSRGADASGGGAPPARLFVALSGPESGGAAGLPLHARSVRITFTEALASAPASMAARRERPAPAARFAFPEALPIANGFAGLT